MLFSIIVPCFNCEDSIRRCLNSILSQSFSDFEIIAIDDGSTDGTSSILDEYDSKYEFIHTYHFSNSGVSISRKRGVTLASGKYIIFVDSDDSINPELLVNLYSTIIYQGDPDIIRYKVHLVDDEDYKDHERYNFSNSLPEGTSVSGIEALKDWSKPDKKYAVYWLFAFKATVFSNVLFVTNLRYYEDIALIPVLLAVSKSITTINYVGYNYTCNNAKSLTNTNSIEAETNRAKDFYKAYLYAVENFTKLANISGIDIAFFVEDYTIRLRKKFDSLPEELKPTFESWFK